MTTPQPPQAPNFIHVYPDVLPAERCREIIRRFEADKRRAPSSTDIEGESKGRSGTLLDLGRYADWQDIATEVNRACMGPVLHYARHYGGLAGILKHEPVLLTFPLLERIDPGQGFNWHVDSGHAGNMDRLLALLLYLQDVEDGGQTQFAHQGAAVPPRAGALAIFPPYWTHLHRGDTPVSGSKYNITNFVVFDSEKYAGKTVGTRIDPASLRQPDAAP